MVDVIRVKRQAYYIVLKHICTNSPATLYTYMYISDDRSEVLGKVKVYILFCTCLLDTLFVQQVGHCIHGNTIGTWRACIVQKAQQFVKIRDDIQLETAATLSVNPTTAYRMLKDFVSLKEGVCNT